MPERKEAYLFHVDPAYRCSRSKSAGKAQWIGREDAAAEWRGTPARQSCSRNIIRAYTPVVSTTRKRASLRIILS